MTSRAAALGGASGFPSSFQRSSHGTTWLSSITLHTHGEVSAAALGCASDPAEACTAGASATAVAAALVARGFRLPVPAAALVLAVPPAAAFVLVAPAIAVSPAAALVVVDLRLAVVALGTLAACGQVQGSLSTCNPSAGCMNLCCGVGRLSPLPASPGGPPVLPNRASVCTTIALPAGLADQPQRGHSDMKLSPYVRGATVTAITCLAGGPASSTVTSEALSTALGARALRFDLLQAGHNVMEAYRATAADCWTLRPESASFTCSRQGLKTCRPVKHLGPALAHVAAGPRALHLDLMQAGKGSCRLVKHRLWCAMSGYCGAERPDGVFCRLAGCRACMASFQAAEKPWEGPQ